jgi:sRNA-binding regulator protein Hfq
MIFILSGHPCLLLLLKAVELNFLYKHAIAYILFQHGLQALKNL